jgi:hypothetical protein
MDSQEGNGFRPGRVVGTLDDVELGFVLDDMRRFLDTLYLSLSHAVRCRGEGAELDDTETLRFFRSKDRADSLKVLLQYLGAYIRNPPPDGGAPYEEQQKAFRQFRDFCRSHLDLLGGADVQEAVRREWNLRGRAGDDPLLEVWRLHGELNGLVESARQAVRDDFVKLFAALERFCLFWFRLRDFHFPRIRRSDFFVFLLSRLLGERCCPAAT